MTHVRFNRCAPALPQYQASNSLVNWLWNDLNQDYVERSRPSANIVEASDDYRIELAVPGYAKNEIKIKLDGQILSITGEPAEAKANENERIVRNEFSRKPFSRSFRLSNWVDSSSIAARFENGILTVCIPKLEEAKSKPAKDIDID